MTAIPDSFVQVRQGSKAAQEYTKSSIMEGARQGWRGVEKKLILMCFCGQMHRSYFLISPELEDGLLCDLSRISQCWSIDGRTSPASPLDGSITVMKLQQVWSFSKRGLRHGLKNLVRAVTQATTVASGYGDDYDATVELTLHTWTI